MKLSDIYLTETIEAAQDLRSLLDQIEQGLKDNAEYIKKHGNPSIYEATEIAKGQCFKHAYELALQLHNQMRAAFSFHSPDGKGEADTDVRLVHAVVYRATDGFRFIHAFVRQGDVIWDCDPSGNPKLAGRIEPNYKANGINKNDPNQYREYTAQEAQKLVLKTKSYNPWDIKYEIDPETKGMIPKGDSMPNMVPEGDVIDGNFGGVTYPRLPHQEVLMAISEWEYGNTPIELSNGYVINAYEEGASADDNAWILKDPQGKEVDSGTGSIVDVMQEFTPVQIDEDVVDGNFPVQQRDREMQQGMEREIKMHKVLERLAQMWWNNDEDPAVERKLADMGWDIGEDEGSDTPSVYVVMTGDDNGNSYTSWPIEQLENDVVEATSSPGRVKRAGASCKGSATELRAKAKKYSGEKGKMYHWCANMKKKS